MTEISKRLVQLAEVVRDLTDAMVIMKIQIMALENNTNLLLKKYKEAKKNE